MNRQEMIETLEAKRSGFDITFSDSDCDTLLSLLKNKDAICKCIKRTAFLVGDDGRRCIHCGFIIDIKKIKDSHSQNGSPKKHLDVKASGEEMDSGIHNPTSPMPFIPLTNNDEDRIESISWKGIPAYPKEKVLLALEGLHEDINNIKINNNFLQVDITDRFHDLIDKWFPIGDKHE